MLDLKPVPREILRARQEAYQRHLGLVVNPHSNRYRLARLLNAAGYSEVTPEHFERSRLATGPGTQFNQDYLQRTYGVDSIFMIYPSTILVPNWDRYSSFWPFKKLNGLRNGLKLPDYYGGVTLDVDYPKGSGMSIKIITVETPHEDVHQAVRLVKGSPTDPSQRILEEFQAMHPDIVLGIRTWEDATEAIVDHIHSKYGDRVNSRVKAIIRWNLQDLESMSRYLDTRRIQYLLLAAEDVTDLSKFYTLPHLKLVGSLPKELTHNLQPA